MWFASGVSALWLAACVFVTASAKEYHADPNVRSIQLRTHTLNQPYLDSDMQSRWFDFGGDTLIRTDSYIRLTSDRPSQTGFLFSRVPLTATNWEIEVEFKISGTNQLYGDGFAMWLTKTRAQEGPVFGSNDNFEGLGIFFDTYKNNRPGIVFPYVMAMVGDGQTSYDKNTDGKNQEFAGCSARGIRHATIPTKFRLTYFQEKQLKLELQYKKPDEWTLCFETDSPPVLPQVAYLGFSAETGELSDNHDIISIQARNLYMSQTNANKATPGSQKGRKFDKKNNNSGGWLWFLFKLGLVAGAIGVGYAGWTAYRAKQRTGRF